MRQWGRMLLAATAVAAIGATTAWAQGYDTASVPFIVNVDATVKAELKEGAAVLSMAEISATANREAVLRIPLQKTDGVRFFGTQRRADAPSIAVSRNGKVTVNLPAISSYRNADVLLYTVNGKRILRYSASAANADGGATRPNLAPGVYLLSVKAADGGVIASRLTHSGGGMSIRVAFGGENPASARQTAKSAAAGYWTITVTAAEAGYVGVSYPFNPAAGTNNELQNIVLSAVPNGEYAVTVLGGGAGATGGGSYAPGAKVSIYAGEAPFGHKFSGWTTESSNVIFVNAASDATTFIMPANAATVKANFEAMPTYAVAVSSAGDGASGGGSYVGGATVTISAGTASAGQRFKNWTTESDGVAFADANSATTTFIMPENAVTVTANFQGNTYAVAVIGGTGGGEYTPGATVNITAGTPPPIYNEFLRWTASNGDVVFADANSAATMFIMPSVDVTVAAVFVLTDNKTYKTTVIGGKTWMAENLNYATSNGSWCYDNADSNCVKYGRLYDWETAMMVCPAGWKLPSNQDWNDLVDAVGGSELAGKKLKATSGWGDNGNGTDEFGFSAIPIDTGEYGFWWTATNTSEDMDNSAIYRVMDSVSDAVRGSNIGTNNRFSVRCIKRL